MSDTTPTGYMERTRLYYRALGYGSDYVWAHHADAPFARLAKPLAESRIAFVSTSSPPDRSNRDDKGGRHVWSGPTDAPPDRLLTHDLAWDKETTHTRDRASFLPIEAAQSLAREGLIAGLTPSFHGIPTEYSHRKTIDVDAPELVRRLRDERSDGVLLFPI
ncbi:MAG: hypothetical protein NT133_07090 [Alphaproteobacteria bacterium]|nr:hypothetical protein [Alphaproteobacteria bacterium]